MSNDWLIQVSIRSDKLLPVVQLDEQRFLIRGVVGSILSLFQSQGEYMSKVREAISAVRKALDELDKALEYEQSACMKMTMDVCVGQIQTNL